MATNITSLTVEVKSQGIREASNALGGLSTSASNATRRIENLITATNKLQAASITSATAAQNLVSKLQQQAQLMASFRTNTAASAASVQALAAATSLLAAAMATLAASQNQADRTQRRHNEGMREAHGLARGLSGSLGALWVTYGALAGVGVGLAIGATLKGIVSMGSDVEHTLEGIRVRGQETMGSIDKMRDSLLELGQGVYGPQAVAHAFETLILAGLNAEQALASVGAALNLATVGGTSVEKSASTLVSVGSSIGYAAEGFSRIGDVIAKTAALSMSSVETLSEAFKSASSVSKLYGVSLEDIATSLGILSNLGIQGSAAGTALKNMYKELASESEKVTKTFAKMGMTSASLRDAAGNFKPLIAMVSELDKGLSTLSAKEEKDAIARLSNERGMRLMVQALDVYRKKTEDGTSALEKFRKEAGESYGFAALGAIQMSMTAKSQMESMGNTLRTVFVKTFKDVEPEIVLFTQTMKSAFQSDGFKNGILSIANAFAGLAITVAKNLPLLVDFAKYFLVVKGALMIGAILEGVAAGFMAIRVALKAMEASALTATVAMPALTAVLVVVAAAWVAYGMAKKDAIANTETEVAAAYSKGLLEGMIKEAEQLKRQTELIKGKMNAQDAAKKADQESAAQKMIETDKIAIRVAMEETEAARRANNVGRYAEGLKKIETLQTRAANNLKIYAAAQQALTNAAKEHAAAVEAQSKNNPGRPDPTNELGGDPSKAQKNDSYAEVIATQDAAIRSARRAMSYFEEQENIKFKAGQMGKLQMIAEIGAKQVAEYGKIQAAIAAKVSAAQGKGDKSEVARYMGEQEQAKEDFANKEITNAASVQLALQKSVEEYTDFRIAQLEKEGSYSTAANLRFQKEHKAAFLQAEADAKAYGDVYPILNQRVEAFKLLQKQAMKDALNKEAVKEFTDAADATRNSLKGIQTASEGQGIGGMFKAAMAATEAYKASLPDLQAKLALITNPADKNEAEAKLINNAENLRKMWVGVGESIGKSLEGAFGRGGDAMGKLIDVGVNYSKLEDKSGEARIKAYGDAASAAKGFFKEGSTGYKVLAGAEKAFRLMELANMAKSLYTHLFITSAKATGTVAGQAVETAATVTGETARNAAKVPGVFMSFMSALGPWGMAAAGIAIAAVLGGAFSGGSSVNVAEQRQKTQGTGSVLGATDAKSESIAKSLEHLEKNSGLGLYHSNEMVKSLKSIQNNIGSLAAMVVQSTGLNSKVTGETGGLGDKLPKFLNNGVLGFVGKAINSIFGGKTTNQDVGFTVANTTVGSASAGNINASSYSDMKKDGGWFSRDKYYTDMNSLGSEANSQFSKIISSFATNLVSANKALGINSDLFASELANFNINIGKISLKGLSGEEIEKELQAVFSKLGDDMAKWAFAGLTPFQKVGEGMLETVARVTNNLIQVKDVFAVLDKQFYLTGVAAVGVSENLIDLAGGIENLTENTKFYVDNFLSEAEKMAPITKSVVSRLAELNIGNITTIDLYKKKIQSLNLMNAADRELYVNMIELAPQFKEMADYAQELAEGTTKLTSAQEKALKVVESARSDLQAAYDKESGALQSVIDKTKSFIATLASYKDSLKLGSDSPLTNMQKYDEAGSQLRSTLEKAMGGDQAAKDKFTSAASAFLAASKIVNASGASYQSDFANVQSMIDKLMASSTNDMDLAQASLDALNKQVQGLLEVNKSVLSVAQAIVNLQAAITAGSNAGLSNAQMGYTPVSNGPVSVNNSQQNGAQMVQMAEAIQAVATSVDALRVEQKAQVGAQVAANVEGTNQIVETLSQKKMRENTAKIALAV